MGRIQGENPSHTLHALRWLNQLRPNVQTGGFTAEEDELIIQTQAEVGNKWTAIAALLPGRTDNAVKNRWNSCLKKRAEQQQFMARASKGIPEPSSASMVPRGSNRYSWLGGGAQADLDQVGSGYTACISAPSATAADAADFWGGTSGVGFWPTMPPTSTPLVATAPPLQLPMPLLSLQPHLSTAEAKAALASASSDVLKKVGGAHYY